MGQGGAVILERETGKPMKTHIVLTKMTRLPGRPDGDLHTLTENLLITEGYTIKGFYSDPPTIGKRFCVDRYERNGEKIEGAFSTSPVQSIERGKVTLITTENSVYRMEELPEEIPTS